MNKSSKKNDIFVYADWVEIGGPRLMGILHSERLRGKEIFSFEYNDSWLESIYSQQLDPDLQLYPGLHYLNDNGKPNFGIFLDSSPDRWGRLLMRRKEAIIARNEKREEVKLLETDYLLGLSDYQRMGALRFKLEENGPFLNSDDGMSAPPWTYLRELENLSFKIENEELIDDPEYINWLNILLAPGSSLGGARPKAGVLSPDGNLWIAKFPSKNDQSNIGAWEMVVYELAVDAGINISESKAMILSGRNHTFLTRRFDRTTAGERIHYASAMTMLGYTDGDDFQDGASYLEIVEFLITHGAATNSDLEELWRRIVFNVCISNTDDHLRNHGFLFTPNGWKLSPAFDINPIEHGTGLKLNISENDNSLDLDLVMSVSKYFRLDDKRASNILRRVLDSVKNWKQLADKYKISKSEQLLKERAFKFI